jgi:hypothetical protein
MVVMIPQVLREFAGPAEPRPALQSCGLVDTAAIAEKPYSRSGDSYGVEPHGKRPGYQSNGHDEREPLLWT